MNIEFFGPQNPFTALDEDWELQTDNANDQWQTATALKRDGDFLRGSQHDGRRTVTINFIGKKIGTQASPNFSLGPLKCGAVAPLTVNGETHYYHVDGIDIAYVNNGHPTLSVSAHAHLAGKGHGPETGGGDGGCRTYTPSLTFPALDEGVPESLGGAFALTAASKLSLRSIRYQMRVNHVDEPDRVGDHLAGDNHDATETLAVDFTGEFGTGDFTIATASSPADQWFRDNHGVNRGNTSVNTTTLNLTHHVQHDVAAGSGD